MRASRSRKRVSLSVILVVVSMAILLVLVGSALAHGDDTVTAQAFIGPVLGFSVTLGVVWIGRAALRALYRR
ncbi:MAG: hypothetical protein ACE5HK_02490 [Candidatus Methylomirabilales bacterium]